MHARRSWLRYLPVIILIYAGIGFYLCSGDGDFKIYWSVARRVLEGGPIYWPEKDIPMAFKYPPWCLPLFFPFAWIPLSIAKILWALVSLIAMYASFYWVFKKLGCPLWTIALTLAVDWGIWSGHFNHGQVGIVILAGLLWFWDPTLPSRSLWRSVGLLYFSTTKIFSVFPLLYFRQLRPWLRAGAAAGAVFVLLTIPAFLTAPSPRLLNLFASWREVASSGVRAFGPWFARGRMNQGLPVLFGRTWDFMSVSDLPDLIGALVVCLILFVWWRRASRRLSPEESWAGWVAWVPLIQPLGWSHNFVLCLPLLSLSLHRAWQTGRRSLQAASLFGLVCTGLLTLNNAKAIGRIFGQERAFELGSNYVEFVSIKSIGVLICALALLNSTRRLRAYPSSTTERTTPGAQTSPAGTAGD